MSSTRTTWIVALAPVAPPCFDSRGQWVEYLSSAAEAWHDEGSVGPLIFTRGQPVTFNYGFTYCADCQAKHSFEMTKRGLCKPDHLKNLAADAEPVGAPA